MAIAAFLLCSVVLHVAWSHSDVCPAPPAAGVSYRFIISVPAGCTPYTSTCTFFAALRTNDNSSSWLGYYMEGVATGYLALGWNNVSQMSLLIQFTELIPNITIFVDHALDVSQSMSDIIACAYNNQTKVVQVVDTWVDAINVVVTDANTGSRPLIVIVGTHRDDAGKCEESIERKNEQLDALVDTKCFRVLYENDKHRPKKLIFSVNGQVPQDVDKKVAKRLRKKIVSMAPKPMKMPIAWFGLEVLLQTSSRDGILSLSECQLHAKKLYIEGDAFSAALNHLVHHNIFLHYPEVLPQVVFCNPQVVLTKVSELVEYHHKLRSSGDGEEEAEDDLDDEGEGEDYVAGFKDWGLLSKEIMSKFKNFYVEGLFTADDLIKLLESRHTIAAMEYGKYFMPALLLHLGEDKILPYLKEGTLLVVRFVSTCIPNGLFCCLVAHLTKLNKASRWNVCTKSKDEPQCLYRNCISFTRHGGLEIVTLIDKFSYIAIHVDKANASRKTQHAQLTLTLAVVERGETYIWRCNIATVRRGSLNDDQAIWFPENTVTTEAPLSMEGEPPLRLLMEKVAAEIPNKWMEVGIQLVISKAVLDVLHPRPQCLEDNHRAFSEIFELWRRRASRPYKWSTIIEVLKSGHVGEDRLSSELTTWIAGAM
eukprot:Em0001g2854a